MRKVVSIKTKFRATGADYKLLYFSIVQECAQS